MQIQSWFRHLAAIAVCGAAALALPAACGGDNNTTPDGSVDATTCAAPLLTCGSECTDPKSDPNNCGACGTKCDTTTAQVCSQGQCALACGGGTTKCGSSCFDTQTDPKNCGGCGKACAQGQACNAGTCGLSCGVGLTLCGDGGAACVDEQTDALNCGACGNVCGPNTTCSAGVCTANLITTASVGVSGTLTGCTTNYSSLGRKTAIDDTNTLYVAMLCSGTLYVSKSVNGGISYSTPVSTGATTLNEAAIAVGAGVNPPIYAAALAQNALLFTASKDGGKTWSTPMTLDNIGGSGFGVSMAVYKDTVYIEANPQGGGQNLHVLRNGLGAGDAGLVDAGDAGFALTVVNMEASTDPNEVLVNATNGDVWVVTDNGSFIVAKSTNGGASFNQAVAPPGNDLWTDWVLAKDTIFVVGTGDPLFAIPTSAPTTDTTVTGLGGGTAQQRSIAADVLGNVYVATPNGSNVRIDRVLFSAATSDGGVDGGAIIESTRNIAAGANVSSTTIAARGANAALVAYTANGGVFATVQGY